MQLMVTITQHDRMPEMLAAVRRGPFAPPSAIEKIEYLFSRVKKGRNILRTDRFGLEHCLSYQRRVHAIKVNFFRRQQESPLGIVTDYWDRTESQQRGSLHAHVLVWLRRRELEAGWTALEPVPKCSNSTAQKQRPRDQTVLDLQEDAFQEDNIYQLGNVARVLAEMVRPNVSGFDWGGYDVAKLRVAGLARSIQYRVPYLHTCSPSYCLKEICPPLSAPLPGKLSFLL